MRGKHSTQALRKAWAAALRLAQLAKYVVPAESGPRKKVTRHAPLDTPDDAGASYGSNWGQMR